MPGSVHASRDGHLGWIVFDHPERRNALSANMWAELCAALRDHDADDEVRVVILRGAGEISFISGADISQFEKVDGRETSKNLRSGSGNAFVELANVRKPVIAMIHGHCIGGGVAVALGADMRYAAEDATFGIPAARLGVGYDIAGIEDLARLVGLSNAQEIFFTAGRYDAAEALRMGLVNRVLPKADLEAFTVETAERIAANAPLTLRSVKHSARELRKPQSQRDHEAVQELIRACFESDDFQEGVKAFMEKRTPEFKGR